MMKAYNKAYVDLFSVNMKILLTWFENVALKTSQHLLIVDLVKVLYQRRNDEERSYNVATFKDDQEPNIMDQENTSNVF